MRGQQQAEFPYFNNHGRNAFPRQDEDDSLQIQEISRQGFAPQPQPNHTRNYQLTFKKANYPQYYFGQQNNDHIHRNLFTETQREIIRTLQKPLSYYSRMSIEELSRLPFADLYSLELGDREKHKLGMIGTILEVKRVGMKAKIVGVNQRCLSVQENISYEDKNKLYLLDLLLKQLSKKQFVELLKLNLAYKRYVKWYGEDADKIYKLSNPQKAYPHRLHQQEEDEEQIQQLQRNQYSKGIDSNRGEDYYEEQVQQQSQFKDQILIFIQILSACLKKTVFSAFKSIANVNRIVQKSVTNSSANISPIKLAYKKGMFVKSNEQLSLNIPTSQQIIQQPEKQKVNQYIQGQQEQQSQRLLQFSQLQQLRSYIEQLIEECAQTNNLAKKYFIKWKIHFLQKIAESILVQLKQSEQNISLRQEGQNLIEDQSQEDNEEDKQQFIVYNHNKIKQKEQNFQEREPHRQSWSRRTSEVSQSESALKEQKRMLRSYLFQNNAKIFFKHFRNHFQQKRIKSICVQLNTEKTLQKAFYSFKNNYRQSIQHIQMQNYYQQIAQSQDEDDSVAVFFRKTTLLHKCFKFLKQNRRDLRLCRILSLSVNKLTFRAIKWYSYQQMRSSEKMVKLRQFYNKKVLFRYFNTWKQDYKDSHGYIDKLRIYKLMKNQEMLGHYFSLFKLQYKKSLIQLLRAEQYYCVRLKKRIFTEMIYLTDESRQFRQRQYALSEYLMFHKANLFMKRLTLYYRDYIDYQRFSVKEERLRRMLVDLHALKSIKKWRANHLRKTAYAAIESKLSRLNSKKKKRQLFRAWLKKALMKRSVYSNESDRHKQWLVRYYDGLCSVLPN